MTYPGPLSPDVADVLEGGSPRLRAFPFHFPKGPWTSPSPDLVSLSPPAGGGLSLEDLGTAQLGAGTL